MIALSSAESEYIALSECTKQVTWLRKLFWEFIHKYPWVREVRFEGTQIMMDSTAAESIAKSNAISASTKHIDIRYHHVKSCVEGELVKISHVQSSENTADLLTKVLELRPFIRLVELIGLHN